MAKSLSNLIRSGSANTPLPASFGGTGLTASGNTGNVLISDGANWISATPPYAPIVVDDISNYFDGASSVFLLTVNRQPLNTLVDSKDLDVFINGLKLSPYVSTITYPWITPYDSNNGFRVSANNLIIYKSPAIGSSASLITRNISTSKQTKQYPYSATTIALGD